MALTQIKTAGIAPDAVTSNEIADDAINSEHYTDGSIDNAHIADDQVDSEHYAAASIDNEHLANDSVNSAQIAEGAVTAGEIAANAVGSSEIAADAVDLTEMAHGTQGDILYYGSSGAPTRLGAGTDGHFLKTQGGSANPVWAAASGGISDVVSDTSPQLGGDLDVNGNQIKGDDVQIHAADDQVIAKFHKTNSSEFHFNGSKKLEVTNTGINVTGSATLSGGLYVGGTGGSNYMDDYEEGTFTPYFHLGSSPGAVTDGSKYLQQDGRYTKVGRFVSATFAVQGKHPDSAFDQWSSGDGFIKGWPFSFQGSQPQQVAFCRVHGGAGSWGTTYAPYVIYENYSDKAHLQAYNSGGVEPPGNVGNSFGFWGSLQYHSS